MDAYWFDERCSFSEFPKSRFQALEEAEKLMCLTPREWECFFRILLKADGWLSFSRGDMSIEWMRHKEDDALCLMLTRSSGHVEKSATYTFKVKELAILAKNKQLGISDYRGE